MEAGSHRELMQFEGRAERSVFEALPTDPYCLCLSADVPSQQAGSLAQQLGKLWIVLTGLKNQSSHAKTCGSDKVCQTKMSSIILSESCRRSSDGLSSPRRWKTSSLALQSSAGTDLQARRTLWWRSVCPPPTQRG